MSASMDFVNQIIAYENGEFVDDDKSVIALFQELVNNGMAWTLQGSYGRTANALLDRGLVHRPRQEKA